MKPRKMLIGLVVMIFMLLCAGCAGPSDQVARAQLGVVQTAYGQMSGVPGEKDGVTIFKGIPYAKPPVGDLRWAAPQNPEGWEGVRVFDSYGDAAMMYTFDGDMSSEPWKSDFYYGELPPLSEDCLYLNVATSAVTGDEKMPVYIWFHGGGLRHGYSYEVEFNPNVLASKGVVVVSVGQRLGVFGYLALPQLSAESGYGGSGNYGLMDSLKALEWVQNNIAAFGGDPNNITIGGQSGGTTKCAGLLMAEQANDMIDRVIWESGLKFATTFSALEEAEKKGVAWLQHLGMKGDESLEELRAKDAKFFMGSVYSEYRDLAPSSMNIDGKYIKVATVREAFLGGRMEGIDIITGTNLGEGDYNTDISNAAEFYATYKELLGDLYDKYDFKTLVPVTDENAKDVARTLSSYGFSGGDSRNITLAQLFGALLDKTYKDSTVYVYLFSHRAPGRDEETRWAWHSSEMWYAFASLRDIPEQRDWEEWDYKLADIMSSYWANFMKTGDPNGEGLPRWLPSKNGALAYIDLGDEIKLDTEIDKRDELMIEYAKRKFSLE